MSLGFAGDLRRRTAVAAAANGHVDLDRIQASAASAAGGECARASSDDDCALRCDTGLATGARAVRSRIAAVLLRAAAPCSVAVLKSAFGRYQYVSAALPSTSCALENAPATRTAPVRLSTPGSNRS